MSIPKSSDQSSMSYANDPEVSAGRAANRDAAKQCRAQELNQRILEYRGSAVDFIDTLVPCWTPFPEVSESEESRLDKLFATYEPEEGLSSGARAQLLEALNTLVQTFALEKRLTMADTHGTKVPFPFQRFHKAQQYVSPDIAVSFPGETLGPLATWRDISMVMEVKQHEAEDHFVVSDDQHARAPEELLKSARNLLLAHGFLSACVVGIYGKTVRLVRVDHSCAIVAPPFSLASGEGGVKLLQKFLWHFVEPRLANAAVVGADCSVARLSPDDQDWVKAQLQGINAKDWEKHVGALDEGRRVDVVDEKTGTWVPYLLYHLVDVRTTLFSCATMVWRAIEDTRMLKDGRLVANPDCKTKVKPQIVKEYWRNLRETAETSFYDHLDEKIPKERRFGIATMVYGSDIGDTEFKWCEEARERREARGIPPGSESDFYPLSPEAAAPAQNQDGVPPTGSAGLHTLTSNTLPEDDYYSLSYPQHQTYSWRLFGDEYWPWDRSHVRMVIDDVGRPLTKFSSTRELVLAMRDAITGHREAWEEAGLLHQDISVGNILILDEHVDNQHVGFLHDFGLSAMECEEVDATATQELMSGEELAAEPPKGHVGTHDFMAWDLLKQSPTRRHLPRHDLESCYWVLLWVVMRHTDCCRATTKQSRQEVFADTFRHSDAEYRAQGAFKFDWIASKAWLDVPGNAPLTALITNLSCLLLWQYSAILMQDDEAPCLLRAYDGFLNFIDHALAMEGWPDNDWVPFKTVKNPDEHSEVAPMLLPVMSPPGYSGFREERKTESPHTTGATAGQAAAVRELLRDLSVSLFARPTAPERRAGMQHHPRSTKRPLERTGPDFNSDHSQNPPSAKRMRTSQSAVDAN